ncbi:protein translocase subunit SecD [Helicobacter sp. MIT 14-3879]|uniref:protein translocase subunit SecD n=1 Tax=Helicobacter sp. MIT 14-3879 TaxID=2040649 RepID=UPI000E1F1D58|nr:protein translocase subunit SecD [Helicobacter sp. MIT 14-3879]RDU65440.1 protein translocase subunit SecD [Helicobacter sp. MIT 14-3879]
MKKFFNFRTIIFIAIFLFGIIFSIPSLFNTSGPRITLGLDLQGGINILLGINTDEAIKSRYSYIATQINYETHDKSILIDSLKTKDNGITFELIDYSQKEALGNLLKSINGILIDENNGKYNIYFSKEEMILIKNSALDQAIDTIRNRLDIYGLTEPSITRQGEENILVQLPGIKTKEEEQKALDLIIRPAQLKMMAVDEDRDSRVNSMSDAEAASYGDVILNFINSTGKDVQSKILLKEIPILDGSMITDARVAYDERGQPVIAFSLNSIGAKIFGDFSGNNIKKRMAVVLDNKVYSAPVIRERIGGGSGQISGNFSADEAKNIAIALRSGALSAPLELLEKRSIGPSLGADSIKSSLIALFGAFFVIILFMIFYYGFAGVIAVSALFVNILAIIAIMSLFGATLTLPGMAGIVLTVGMAIDANIIINERIREALRSGKNIVQSISFGYVNATRAIFDANNTTLIIAVLLYVYGTGPIKGFAVTMGIGILASIITAIIGTHGIYLWLGEKINHTKKVNFWFGIKLGEK